MQNGQEPRRRYHPPAVVADVDGMSPADRRRFTDAIAAAISLAIEKAAPTQPSAAAAARAPVTRRGVGAAAGPDPTQGSVGGHPVSLPAAQGVRSGGADPRTARGARAGRAPAGAGAADPVVQKIALSAEEVWQQLNTLSRRATPQLAQVAANVTGYLRRYDAAYADFVRALDESERAAAERDKWSGILVGIMIGVGVGIASGGLLSAAVLVGKASFVGRAALLAEETLAGAVVWEAAGEAAEAAIGSVLQSSTTDGFTPPTELQANAVARGQFEQLASAWRALALIQYAALQFSPVRDGLRDRVNGVASSAASATIGHDQVISTAIDELRSGLRGTDHALSLFVTTMGSPMFERTQPEIEQDLWIRWLSQRSPDQRIPGPAEARMRTRRVFARLVPENVGYFHEELMPLAAAEARRLERVGRPGVVIVPPRHRENSTRFEPGVVHLRHDTYAATGRVDPEQYVDEYLEIAHQPGVFLRTGEVVIVDATTSSMVTASRTGREVRTSETEQQVARRMLGIKSFTPEAADTLAPLVARGLKEEGLPVTVTSTEDGALVVDPEGRPVILFAPHTDVVEAEGRLERTGALRVVAIGMDPRHAVSDYRSARVLVTTGSSFDHALLVREVRSALAALYQRGTTVPLPPPPALRAADVNRATGVTGSSKR